MTILTMAILEYYGFTTVAILTMTAARQGGARHRGPVRRCSHDRGAARTRARGVLGLRLGLGLGAARTRARGGPRHYSHYAGRALLTLCD